METAPPKFFKCSCPGCGQHIEYPVEGAGHTIACPACQRSLILPEGSTATTPTGAAKTKTVSRNEPATQRQRERLLSFGIPFPETITKSEASELIDRGYRSRPPTPEQLEAIERIGISNELPPNPTMGDAKETLRYHPPTRKQIRALTDAGFKVREGEDSTAEDLDLWIKLAGAPPSPEDTESLKTYGLKFCGDGFATAVLVALIGHLQDISTDSSQWNDMTTKEEQRRIARACLIAMKDPEYSKITFKVDEVFGGFSPTWPKEKLKQWFNAGRA